MKHFFEENLSCSLITKINFNWQEIQLLEFLDIIKESGIDVQWRSFHIQSRVGHRSSSDDFFWQTTQSFQSSFLDIATSTHLDHVLISRDSAIC